MSEQNVSIQTIMPGFVTAGLVTALIVPTLIKFAPLDRVLLVVMLISTGVIFTNITADDAKRSPRASMVRLVIGGISLIAALFAFGITSVPASRESTLNDRRCVTIERDMVAEHPRHAQSRDLFVALGCHPQPIEVAEAEGHPDYLITWEATPSPALHKAETPPPRPPASR